MNKEYRRLNNEAKKITDSFCKDVDVPVDIEGLIKEKLDTEVEDYILHPYGLILGMCSNTPQMVKVKKDEEIILVQLNEHVIFIDSGLLSPNQTGRRRFTIAHEAGHRFLMLLDRKNENVCHRLYRSIETTKRFDINEWRANVFGACLLMPEDNVRYQFNKFIGTDYIEKLSPFDLPVYWKFLQMAKFFQVSGQALAIRLKNLKLIDDFSFKCCIPRISLDIFVDEEN